MGMMCCSIWKYITFKHRAIHILRTVAVAISKYEEMGWEISGWTDGLLVGCFERHSHSSTSISISSSLSAFKAETAVINCYRFFFWIGDGF